MKSDNKGKSKQPAKVKVTSVPAKQKALAEKAIALFAQIDQPFGRNPPEVHYPICAANPAELEPDVEAVKPCSHAAFVYSGLMSGFAYESQDFKSARRSFTNQIYRKLGVAPPPHPNFTVCIIEGQLCDTPANPDLVTLNGLMFDDDFHMGITIDKMLEGGDIPC